MSNKIPTTYHVPLTTYQLRGFTLLEVLIFVGIFSAIVVVFMTAFVSVSQIHVRQAGAAEVESQSQFLLQTIQYYVERSSVIEMPADTATTTLRLRMPSSAEDPVVFDLANGAVTLRSGTSAPARNITSGKVSVTTLNFTRRTNSPGHDSVAVDFMIEYNTSNLKLKFAQGIKTSIARVSAAQFDSDIVASSSNLNLGPSAGNWRSINSTIYFSGSNVGIGVSSPAKRLQVSGDDVYLDTANTGVILKAPNGTSCYRLSVTNTGALATTSLACP